MERNWKQVTSFTPSLWIAPLAANKKECEAAKGRFMAGVIQGYEMKPNAQGTGNNHFYTLAVEDTDIKEAQVYVQGLDGKGDYQPVPVELPNVYSIRAPAQLNYLLAKYWTHDMYRGCPVKITYLGLKDVEGHNVHQFRVDEDADYTPQLAAPAPVKALGHDAPVPEAVEEPLPAFDPEA